MSTCINRCIEVYKNVLAVFQIKNTRNFTYGAALFLFL